MERVLFICHGNICRSPMAEFIFKDLVNSAGLNDEFVVESMATTNDDLGADTYYETKRQLDRHGIPYTPRRARRFKARDYDRYDHIYVMDQENLDDMDWILKGDPKNKVELLLKDREIDDPWYTRNFNRAFEQIYSGCVERFKELTEN